MNQRCQDELALLNPASWMSCLILKHVVLRLCTPPVIKIYIYIYLHFLLDISILINMLNLNIFHQVRNKKFLRKAIYKL